MSASRGSAASIALWLGAFALLAGWFWYTRYDTPCRRTIHYSIGQFDERFGESREAFLQAAAAAEAVWEEPTGFPLFAYDPAAAFKLNLVYDERQQATDTQRELEAAISDSSASFDAKKATYDTKRAEYDRRSAALTAEINRYNAAGGAPEDAYRTLEAERKSVNALADELNKFGDQLNLQAADLNQQIEAVNSQAGQVFDQATYVGDAINLYEFKSQQDLVLALAHEFGHALTLDHVDDPHANMYYLLKDQNLTHPTLAEADLAALRQACTARLIPRSLSAKLGSL